MEAQEFSFTIPESWEAVKRVLARVLDRSPDDLHGVERLEEEWRYAKAELLGFFPETGRVVVDLAPEDGDYTPPPEVCEEARDAAVKWLSRRLREKYGAPTPTYCPADPAACAYEVAWTYCTNFSCPVFRPLRALYVLLGQVGWAEVASGRLEVGRKYVLGAKEREFPEGMRLGGFLREILLEIRFLWVPESPAIGYLIHSEAEERKLAERYSSVARLTQWDVEQVVTALSMMTSRLKAQKARLVVSVNPLDLLLVSEHTTGWRSCHRLLGEYRTGPLAYICDSTTAVAYVYTRTVPCELAGGLVLPVKVWREMVYFDLENAAAIFSRHYPEHRPEFEKATRRVVAHLIAKHLGLEGEPRWKYRKMNGSGIRALEEEDEEHQPASHAVRTYNRVWHYQDDPCSGIRLLDRYACVEPGVLEIPCPVCGEARGDRCTNSLLCDECGGAYRCVHCGDPVPEGEAYFVGDDVLCGDCCDELCDTCHECGELFYTEDLYWGPDDYRYCEHCFDDLFTTCDACNETVARDDVHYVGDAPYCEDCFRERFVYCARCDEPVPRDEAEGYEGCTYCTECFLELFVVCDRCSEPVYRDEVVVVGDLVCCRRCAEVRQGSRGGRGE